MVLGVLAALLEAMGAQQVQAHVGDEPVYPQAHEPALTRLAASRQTAQWTFTWQNPPGIEHSPVDPNTELPLDLVETGTWPAVAQSAGRLVLADLIRPLPVADLARSLGFAPRSLQRALAQAGLTYSAVIAETRRRAAAWRLIKTDAPLAEVGFVCGYADQPHFTRDFRDKVGLTPARYRVEFALTAV